MRQLLLRLLRNFCSSDAYICSEQIYAKALGRIPGGIVVGSSLVGGVIADYDLTEAFPRFALADNPMAATVEGIGVVLGGIDYLAKNRKK